MPPASPAINRLPARLPAISSSGIVKSPSAHPCLSNKPTFIPTICRARFCFWFSVITWQFTKKITQSLSAHLYTGCGPETQTPAARTVNNAFKEILLSLRARTHTCSCVGCVFNPCCCLHLMQLFCSEASVIFCG